MNQDAPHNTFTACYGPDNSGNIFLDANLRSFEHEAASSNLSPKFHAGPLFVLAGEQRDIFLKYYLVLQVNKGTQGIGLALLMGDGGFSVEGEENLQELHMKQLVLCQFLAALMNIKVGGVFVCKIFDCFTPFTVGCLYCIYRSFADFAIIKPVTSRPANSERYVVARHKWLRRPPVVDYLLQVNAELNAVPKRDVVEAPSLLVTRALTLALALGFQVVPNGEMTEEFKEYMKASSIDIGEKQIEGPPDLRFPTPKSLT